MPRASGGLERALADLTIGATRQRKAREKQLYYTAGKETEQQVRVPLTGKVENGWGFADKGVGFALPFIWLPAQRGAPYRTPHFSFGIEHISGTDELVIIHCTVLSWNIDSSSRVRGAKIRYAASAPMLAEGERKNFTALAHLTFQGWAAEGQVDG